jgi:hypothetical protein
MEVEVLGLEADSDWVLYGPHTQDDSLIRNAFMYGLSNQVGRYAVRTRFCEVFVSEGATLGSADYVGLYVLMEKITLGEHRVDVEELTPDIVEEPEISGGYIFKIDRLDPNDQGFTAGNQQLAYVDPKEEDMVKRPEQAAWIKEYIDAFGDALGSEDFADPVNGYAAYIDVDSWIDHHILNEFAKNVDGFRLSAFFFKPRGGKIQAGPIWDFDLSLTRHREPGGAEGWSTSRFSVLWWVRLFEDEAFEDRMRSRWRELRQGAFQLENLLSVVDSMADEIREAQARNFERWNIIFGGTTWQEDEIDRLKTWITQRVAWMDGALVKPPELSHPGGPVAPGLELTMSVARGEVYYTLNGPDPRGKNDLPDPAALRYVGPIVLDGNVRVIARTFTEDGLWSPDVRGDYLADIPPLVLTESMYHPRAADTEGTTSDLFEFIELHNAGTETIDLTQVRFTGIPDFDFANGAVSSLAPGEHVVVVSDLESFRARYGDAMDDRIAGDYDRSLGNRGQILRLVATLIEGSEDQELWRMRYEASWHPSTDGAGHSLVLVDPATPPELYGDAATWQPSAEIDGSPGRADGVQAGNFRQPGDMNGDNRLNIVDVLGLLNGLTGRTVLPCDSVGANTDLGDMNGDGRLNVLDPLHLLSFLFRDGAAPEAGLDCISLPGCPESCEG